jgi:hypothetical protein
MRNDISLHIFTNATASAPDTQLIERTYQSFCETFGHDVPVTVWCDLHPNITQGPAYLHNLRRLFDAVHETQSLSDGFVRAVKVSTAPYLFMLEHDWQFLSTITHSLTDIITAMEQHDLLHLRFNKRANVAKKSDRALQPVDHPPMPYCTTGFLSNNPHIIHRERYIQRALPWITVREKTYGIEKDLSQGRLQGAIYGPADHPATVEHLDGKTYEIHTRP